MTEISEEKALNYALIIIITAWVVTGLLIFYLLSLTGGSWWPMIFLLIPLAASSLKIKFNIGDGKESDKDPYSSTG